MKQNEIICQNTTPFDPLRMRPVITLLCIPKSVRSRSVREVVVRRVLRSFAMSKMFKRRATPSSYSRDSIGKLNFVDLPRLPPEPTAAGVSELSGWWLELRPNCRCGKTRHLSFQRIYEIAHPYNPTLAEILPRVRCQKCGSGPGSVYLTDLDADGQDHSKPASFKLRLR